MATEPAIKRVHAFVDGQNLFHAAKSAFGCAFPNYDVLELSRAICSKVAGWNLDSVRFYTGVPDPADNWVWSEFWSAKLRSMSRQGVATYSRRLVYRNKPVRLSDGSQSTILVGEEKGIDVRLALDVVGGAVRRSYDVALIFSQDQDLSEVADEIRVIARDQGRWIKVACAFPSSPVVRNQRGINKTDWLRIDRATYDRCIDPYDYRPRTRPG